MKILVLDGNQNQAVACVRSLARHGHIVHAGESQPWSKAGWSRYASGSFRYPAPQIDPQAFVASIRAEAAKQPGTLILPMTELATLLLSEYRESLIDAGARLVLPDHSDLLRAVDKGYTTQLAESLGVAIPHSSLATSSEEAREICRQLHFPVVLKPKSSQEQSASGALRTTGRPVYARNVDELMAAFARIGQYSASVLVQEFIEGTGTGYFALMNNGEVRAEFAHRRIRDVHPTGSGSALRESILPTAQIREASLAMLRALHWHGVRWSKSGSAKTEYPSFLKSTDGSGIRCR
jgi:predicted ATP-grasp superfamily ATP-dependent carboligase